MDTSVPSEEAAADPTSIPTLVTGVLGRMARMSRRAWSVTNTTGVAALRVPAALSVISTSSSSWARSCWLPFRTGTPGLFAVSGKQECRPHALATSHKIVGRIPICASVRSGRARSRRPSASSPVLCLCHTPGRRHRHPSVCPTVRTPALGCCSGGRRRRCRSRGQTPGLLAGRPAAAHAPASRRGSPSKHASPAAQSRRHRHGPGSPRDAGTRRHKVMGETVEDKPLPARAAGHGPGAAI